MQNVRRKRETEVTQTQEMSYTNSEISRMIDDRIHNELHRLILKDRLINGYTHEQIAEKYHYSVRQIKRIIYKALNKIANYI